MMQLITGFWTSCCIYAAAKLNIAALLAEGPMTAGRLPAATRTHEPSLYRLLRALAGAGIFRSGPDGAFSLTPLGQTLRPDRRVLVLESVIPEDDSPHPGKFMDLNMLAMTGGRERTEREFSALFAQAGLRLRRVIPTHSPLFGVVEAVKA